MYLSRLILNPANRRVQSELARPYEMHRTIMRAFPDRLDREADRVLFRLEEDAGGPGLALLVQSMVKPDWAFLDPPADRGYLLPVHAGLENPALKEFEPSLTEGQTLAFRLRANPTKRLSAGKGHKGKRVGIYDEEGQVDWLRRKGEQHGFQVLRVQVRDDGKVWIGKLSQVGREDRAQAAREGDAKGRSAEMLTVKFDGLLRVTDPECLVRAVESGIGSGKGFGFGLLSLARPDRLVG